MPECNILNTLPKNINGPYNMVRLEGDVNGLRKVIYIMFDQHIYHTECNTLPNLNIHNYLDQFFRNIPNIEKDTMFDFFLEIDPESTFIQSKKGNEVVMMGEPYILKLWKLFSLKMNYDPQKNVNYIPEDYPNTRFHLIDIRARYGYLKNLSSASLAHGSIYHIPIKQLEIIARNYNFDLVIQDLDTMKKIVETTKNTKTDSEIVSKLANERKTLVTHTLPEDFIYRMGEKLRSGYKHQNIKKEMDKIIDHDFVEESNRMIEKINDFKKLRETSNNMYYVLEQFDKLLDLLSSHLVRLMDIYMLRRFLDKDYIKNCVGYVGGHHGNNYVIDLVSNFNFEITHVDKISDPNVKLDELNEIAKSKNWDKLDSLLLRRTQCINLNNFPPNFM